MANTYVARENDNNMFLMNSVAHSNEIGKHEVYMDDTNVVEENDNDMFLMVGHD